MPNNFVLIPSLALAGALVVGAQAPAQTKVGIIHIQNAIVSTQEGRKASDDLQQRYEPKRKEIEEKQKEIAALQDQLSRGANTMSDEAKEALTREIEQKTRSWRRAAEDAQTDFDQDRNRILQKLGQRMMVVIDKYARDNGYAVILDISSPQTPVLYAANGIDITDDIVVLYDKGSAPATSTAPAAAPSKLPPVPKPAAAAPKRQP